jgi:hypothetical protein
LVRSPHIFGQTLTECGYYIHIVAVVGAGRAISFMVYAECMFHTLKLAGELPEVT